MYVKICYDFTEGSWTEINTTVGIKPLMRIDIDPMDGHPSYGLYEGVFQIVDKDNIGMISKIVIHTRNMNAI